MMFIGLMIAVILLLGIGGVLTYVWPTKYGSASRSCARATSSSAEALRSPPATVQILVLGDIGHSPRMQYHAQSIAKHGGRVSIVGYLGS